jgi:3-dehydroquinate synthase
MSATIIQSNGYDICIGNKAIDELNLFFHKAAYKHAKVFVLVDENSLKHCLPVLSRRVDKMEDAAILEIESGEASKNIEVCTRLWRALGELGADRNSVLLNLGGGVIGDLGGFVASAYKRGIAYVNLPTTLLAQVDASVGGKVGVDLDHLKNEVGMFSAPEAVFIYPDFLKTLPGREMMSGFAEVVKHALIADAGYWEFVQGANVADNSVWERLIEKSVRIKNEIVMADPKEKELRKSLNFGHTIGHAIESYFLESSNKSLLHGEAVAVGMIAEAYISFAKNKISESELNSIRTFILERFGHIEIDSFADHRLLELMRHDKKNSKGELNFTLLTSLGTCEVNRTADLLLVKEALKYYREALLIS